MIQFEITTSPFSISFKQNGLELVNLRIPASPLKGLWVDDEVVAADFPDFSLNLKKCSESSSAGSEQGWILTTTPANISAMVAAELTGHWYGGGELIHQQFPLNKVMMQSGPFQTFDNGPTGLSGKLTPAWFSSNGVLLIADSPVEVGLNQPPAEYPHFKWSFATEERGAFSNRPFRDNGSGDKSITFKGNGLALKIFFTGTVIEATKKLIAYYGHPSDTPPDELFAKPTWTTWARYKSAINQNVVMQYAEDIIKHDYPFNVLEIDDRWQVFYGDLHFDPERFPSPRRMIDELHKKGFKVTAWVIPFMDPKSQAFAESVRNEWIVRKRDGSAYLIQWWQGNGGLLDVTNPSALDWFFERLRNLQVQTGLDGFKFDAGEACFLPADAVTYREIHPNEYTQIYVDAIARHYRLTEVRSGWMNQRAPIFFRQWDKTTSWGLDNGLHSVLTGILALGLAGYPFILPDMVGGNEYDEKASAEMMIRWTQLNALLPAMQFSLPPWEYGEECAVLCRRYAALHAEFAHRILSLARETVSTGVPIIRPVFWLAPQDEVALTCDDQFLLGNDILVAPIVCPNQYLRDIYLPPGHWRDHWTKELFKGAGVLKQYPAPLDRLPFFERC